MLAEIRARGIAIEQAEIACQSLDDWYLHCRVAQSQSLLSRIAGNMDRAASSMSNLGHGPVRKVMDKRTNSVTGQMTIQSALNYIQVEDLSAAKRALDGWSPLDKEPSPIEQVMVFRKDMLLGKILRFQGLFKESLMHIEKARKTSEHCRVLMFDEDLRDLTCDQADTLRELNDPSSGECHLRAEITRRQKQNSVSSDVTLLQLSLAEALFAQEQFDEAEQLCLDIQPRPRLLKFEKLRLHVTMAKIRHMKHDNHGALSSWSEALKEIGKFQLHNGRTTRLIVVSICDVLSGLGQTWLVHESEKQVAALDEKTKPGGVQCWIAGMRHWAEYLQSRSLRSRI